MVNEHGDAYKLATQIEERLLERNALREVLRARGPAPGGGLPRNVGTVSARRTLLAFGRGPYATDAQHVSVEFVHPVIVGKRALARARSVDSLPSVAAKPFCVPKIS